jgi:hypothetical protein
MASEQIDTNEYWFTVNDDGVAIVMVISADGSWSQHSSEDDTEAEGDGAICAYDWKDSYRWDRTTKEHAESMLKFEFSGE